jgi:hypothetical protein
MMTDLSFLLDFVNPIILGICLAVGFALKEAFSKFPNKYIPLASLLLGTVLVIVTNFKTGITLEVVLSGMISGLGATGLYELLRNFINKEA